MATREYLESRVEGKQKEIAKLEKKLERILKAQASNWENNPYYYSENDLKWTTKDLESAKKALADWELKLSQQIEKDNSRDVVAILQFLEAWKERVTSYYKAEFEKFPEANAEWSQYSHEHTDWWNAHGWRCKKENPEEYKRREQEYEQRRSEYHARWNFITPYVSYSWQIKNWEFNDEKFQKELTAEANAKYDFIIERTNAIVGQITDASNLKVGNKGDLNGYIIGTKGTANVQTIGAGGYNIQCFHFRTLIHEV